MHEVLCGLMNTEHQFEFQLPEPPRFKVQGSFIRHILNYTGYNQKWNALSALLRLHWMIQHDAFKTWPAHRMQVKPCANISGLYQHWTGPCTEIPLRCSQGPWYDGTGMWMKRHVESMLLSSRIILWCWQPRILRALLFWEVVDLLGCWRSI